MIPGLLSMSRRSRSRPAGEELHLLQIHVESALFRTGEGSCVTSGGPWGHESAETKHGISLLSCGDAGEQSETAEEHHKRDGLSQGKPPVVVLAGRKMLAANDSDARVRANGSIIIAVGTGFKYKPL